MRLTASAGLFALTYIVFALNSPVQANALNITNIEDMDTTIVAFESTNNTNKKTTKPKKITYVVKQGDSLTKIAKKYDTTWKRIYNKNKTIKNPDIINVGEKLTIPGKKEKLKNRVIKSSSVPQNNQTRQSKNPTSTVASNRYEVKQSYAGQTSSNTYSFGYCTWYAKNKRPDLPNNLGNANTWFSNAAAQGFATGYTPRVGAIGQQGMHVVYVETVHANGTVTISEMNYGGWNTINTRTVAASNFIYIY